MYLRNILLRGRRGAHCYSVGANTNLHDILRHATPSLFKRNMPSRPRNSCMWTMACVLGILVLLAVCALILFVYTKNARRRRTSTNAHVETFAPSPTATPQSCPYAKQIPVTPLGCVTYNTTSADVEGAREFAFYNTPFTPREALCLDLMTRFGTTADRIHRVGSDEPYCQASIAADLAANNMRDAIGASELPISKDTMLTVCPQATAGKKRCIYTQVQNAATTPTEAQEACSKFGSNHNTSSLSVEVLPFKNTSPSISSLLLSSSPTSIVTPVSNPAFPIPKQCSAYAAQADDDIGQLYEGHLVQVCGTPNNTDIQVSSKQATGTCSANSADGCRAQCNATTGCNAFTYDDGDGCMLLSEPPSSLQNVGTSNNTSSVYTCTTLPPPVTQKHIGVRQLQSSTCNNPRTGVGCADDTCKYIGSASCTDDGVCAPLYGVYDAPTQLSPNVYSVTSDTSETACRQKWLDAYEMALGKDNMDAIRNAAAADSAADDSADISSDAYEWYNQLKENIETLCSPSN